MFRSAHNHILEHNFRQVFLLIPGLSGLEEPPARFAASPYPAATACGFLYRRAMFMKMFPLEVSKHRTMASVSSVLLEPCSEVSSVGGCTRKWNP